MFIQRVAHEGAKLGTNIAYHMPVVGPHIRGFFDHTALVERIHAEIGNRELGKQQARMHVAETDVRQEEVAALAAGLLIDHLDDGSIPRELQPPVQALVDLALPTRNAEPADPAEA